MQQLPVALNALGAYKQFVLVKLVPSDTQIGKTIKKPMNPHTGVVSDAHDPSIWVDAQTAINLATVMGDNVLIGFVLTDNDPFWFVDIDDCLQPDGAWSPVANELCNALAGAAVEISQSGRGLHIIGSGPVPDHGCKNSAYGLEFYHSLRVITLTGTQASGDVSVDLSQLIPAIVDRYFPPGERGVEQDWSDTPVDEWNGPADDMILIGKMLNSKPSAEAIFGDGKATFKQLWENDEAALAKVFPVQNEVDPYDRSSADASIAQHLAFWTGKNHARIERLMRQSALVRDKWDGHPTYVQMTVSNAVNRQKDVYASKNKQLTGLSEAPETVVTMEIEYTTGDQLLTHTQLADLFKGCVYVRDVHRMYIPDGSLLKAEQFKAMYGGYTFGVEPLNERTTRNAFEAFTENQVIRFPKVTGLCFRPQLPPGTIIQDEGRTRINTYTPVNTRRREGDATPFLNHLNLLLPHGDDALIALCYMAACVQHPGVKFQWAPVMQGVEGNGKTLLSLVVAHAVGQRYTHSPKASDIANKHNAWVERKLFGYIEEIFVADRRELLEDMKTLITNNSIEVQPKGVDQYMAENFVNFIINTNHKDGIPVTLDTRRYAILYCNQQTRADKNRDFPGNYFIDIYKWLREEGYEIVNELLQTFEIDERYNPAGNCQDAPRTSSTLEAVELSRGGVEQEIMEAIEEDRPGFAKGWVSGHALDKLLVMLRADRKIPQRKRRELMQQLGYDWHPALPDGRVNNRIAVEGGKPKLYIKTGHIHTNLTTCVEVVKQYTDAQGYPAMLAVTTETTQ